MPLYHYKCANGCRYEWTVYGREGTPCPIHSDALLRREYGFRIAAPFQEHFSQATGQYVRNKNDLMDQAKVASEKATERLGIEHNYQIMDTRDLPSLGVTPDVIDQVGDRWGPDAARKLAKEVDV